MYRIVFLFALVTTQVMGDNGHGEPCLTPADCDLLAGLTCDNSTDTCACSDPTSMVYNVDAARCLSLAEGTCYSEPIDGIERPCVPNTDCVTEPEMLEGICACSKDFYQYEDRTCGVIQASQTFKEICNATHYCDVTAALLCDYSGVGPYDGVCLCAVPDHMVFDQGTQTCRALANGPVSTCYTAPIGGVQRKCVENAICSQTDDDPPFNGRCLCDQDYLPLEDRTCAQPELTQGFGATCNSTHKCDLSSILHCDEAAEKCGCVPNSGMVYEEESSACVSLVGPAYNCFLKPHDGVQRKCVKNAGCLPRLDSPLFGYCACAQGFAPNADNTCGVLKEGLGFGEACNSTWLCSPASLLICQENSGNCGCSYSEDIYEEGRSKCLSPASGLCHTSGEGRECTPNADCQPFSLGSPYGICQCENGFLPSQEGRCETSEATTPSQAVRTNSIFLLSLVFEFSIILILSNSLF